MFYYVRQRCNVVFVEFPPTCMRKRFLESFTPYNVVVVLVQLKAFDGKQSKNNFRERKRETFSTVTKAAKKDSKEEKKFVRHNRKKATPSSVLLIARSCYHLHLL